MRNRNIILLSISQALALCGPPMVLLAGGIIGMEMAPTASLATLPTSIMVIGVAVFTIPAAMIMRRIGRRAGFMIGAASAGLGAMLAAFALSEQSFFLFCLGTLFIGVNSAFAQQYRFAASESVEPAYTSRAVSFVLLGGVLAGFLGPEIGKQTRDWLASGAYVGSFASLAALYALIIGLMLFLRDVSPKETTASGPERPLRQVIAQPSYRLAALAAGVAYGVMSFIMTATPIQMHKIAGHSLDATTLVIQSHIIAMFLPSLVSGFLIERLGIRQMMGLGSVALLVCVYLGLTRNQVLHYWAALVLLGIGWNFLFVSGTTLLTRSYRPAERFKAQAANDFMIFGIQAAASLAAGSVLVQTNWQMLNLLALPVLGLMIFTLVTSRRHILSSPQQPAATD